jgi:16S rRNA (adenine1518-N6/adenine1519-N6)-dimethyltransferase
MEIKKTTDILKLFNIKGRKEFGQNFLSDEAVLDRIPELAEISKDDLVIEIGPGIGSLTQRLCIKAGYVAAVEIDRNMKLPLGYVLNEHKNFEIIFNDIMKLDIKKDIIEKHKTEQISKVKVAANLPYYIATAIITDLLSKSPGIDKMIFMVQKEVAERLCAKPGGRDYGVLSIAVQLYAKAGIVLHVPAGSFIPAPKVDSALVLLDISKDFPLESADIPFFFKIVKASFSQRRKTAANSLFASFGKRISKDEIEHILKEIGQSTNVRAEKISIEQFIKLAEKLRPLF